MSTNPNNVSKWNVSDNEKGTIIEIPYISASNSSFRLYMPTLMPLIPTGKPTQIISSLSKSCFVNDSSCKPSVASTTKTQNYITVRTFPNRPFKNTHFMNGAELIVEVFNNDVHNMKVSNKLDNSINL